MTQKIISVFGSSSPKPGANDYEQARTVGRLLAQAGFTVQTGGYSGVMSAVSQGANEAGGHVIGVTCRQIEQFRSTVANQWVKEELKQQTLRERLLYLIDNCQGAITMPGGIGTLSELSLIWSFVQVNEISARPIVVVGNFWRQVMATISNLDYIQPNHLKLITIVDTAEEAAQTIIEYYL